MKARELEYERESLSPAPQTRPSDAINKQTCCVRIDALFSQLLPCHSIPYLSMYYYSLYFCFAFKTSSVIPAPRRHSEWPETLAGRCSSNPAAPNGLSFASVLSCSPQIRTNAQLSDLNSVKVLMCHTSPHITNHSTYSTFPNGLANSSKTPF